MFAGRRVVLGVSGGIAAYKAVEVCRRLVDAGAHVIPVLTDGALRRLHEITPAGYAAAIDLSITDDFPLAQAIVIISAVAQPPQGRTDKQ